MSVIPNHYWRIRWEVVRNDGTIYHNYTPIHYNSYEECEDHANALNAENGSKEFPVFHYIEEVTIHPNLDP